MRTSRDAPAVTTPYLRPVRNVNGVIPVSFCSHTEVEEGLLVLLSKDRELGDLQLCPQLAQERVLRVVLLQVTAEERTENVSETESISVCFSLPPLFVSLPSISLSLSVSVGLCLSLPVSFSLSLGLSLTSSSSS